jgi:hypothetical protein
MTVEFRNKAVRTRYFIIGFWRSGVHAGHKAYDIKFSVT